MDHCDADQPQLAADVFERSRCVVKVCQGVLRRAGGEIFDSAWIEGFSAFRSQCQEHAFLCLERRAKQDWKLLEIIQEGSILHEVHTLAFDMGLDFSFDEEVEEEVEGLLSHPLDTTGCEDMRSYPFVTVDGPGTRDLDQALYVARADERLPITPVEGVTHVVCYAIADASWFVRPGSPLYRAALARGTSIYFAGMSVPMLPSALSRGLISLNPCVDRRALVFIMSLDGEGKCVNTILRRAVIHSFAKLTTDDVEKYLQAPDQHRFSTQPYATSLLRFQEVGEMRRHESETRNVVQFNRVALYTSLNAQRTAFILGMDERSRGDLYNEQLSLLCNMEGAKILNVMAKKDPEVLAIFRNHEAPSKQSIDLVEHEIAAIVRAQGLDERWHWQRDKQSLGSYLNQLPEDEPGSDRFFRIRQAIERSILMMQRRSVFSPQAGMHSALGVNPYARFSAPMREIVGVFTHKEAIEAQFDVPPESILPPEQNAALRTSVIQAANRAREIQREIDKAVDSCAIGHILSHDIDLPLESRPIYSGTILGMKSTALYVRLDMPPIELKVYVYDMQELTGEGWQVDETLSIVSNVSGTRRYAIGDTAGIRVYRFLAAKKKWRVILV